MQPRTIWVDVEDLLEYFAFNPRPSGIQRLAFELERALLQRTEPGRVRFVRRGADATLREVPWSQIEACFAQRPHATSPDRPVDRSRERRRQVQALIQSLPPHLRTPLFRAGLLQQHALRNWRELARTLRRRRRAVRPTQAPRTGPGVEAPVQAGDVFLVLGAPWAVAGFAPLLAELKRRHRIDAHLLLYDLVPIRHREWCTKALVRQFDDWLDASLPLFDGLMAISQHTADDVAAYARERGLPIAPVHTIPVGAGLRPAPDGARPIGLPRPGHYVLFVSTLEARKNHALAVRVWRRLDDEIRAGRRSPDSVPDLVFAGRVGWLVADLLQQLDNMRWLGGRIRLIPDPSDAELRALYAGCRFTLFPSWFEGWGLPVSESLAFGKPCIASSAAALPEAGGTFCRYFDPGDTDAAYRQVAAVLDDPSALDAWQARIGQEYLPTPWTDAAGAVLSRLP